MQCWKSSPQSQRARMYFVLKRFKMMPVNNQTGISATTLAVFLAVLVPIVQSQTVKPQTESQQALANCEASSSLPACRVAAQSNLPPKQRSEAYTFWADTSFTHFGESSEPSGEIVDPVKMLRKALELDPNNSLATYLLAVYIPNSNCKYVEEKEQLLKRAAQLRPDWEAPHVRLALSAEPYRYQTMIAEWQAALKFGPHDPFYEAKLKDAQEKFAAQKRDLAEKEAKAKVDPPNWVGAAEESAKFMCDVPKAEEWSAKYLEFHGDGHSPDLELADTYAACGQPEKARAMYREAVALYEKSVNTGLQRQKAIQVQTQQLAYLDLQAEAYRMHIILITIFAREKDWWRVQVECQEAERLGTPTPELYAHHANALIQGAPPGYEVELQEVLEKGLKLDPKFLNEHPEFHPHYKEPAKQ